MSKDAPNTEPFETLKRLVDEEAERTRQYPKLVKVAQDVASGLTAMDSHDWYEASRGFSDFSLCEQLAQEFANQGAAAITGLSISVVGPKLELSEDLAAGSVEIVLGIPHPN